jgi:predicted enzyme related to lactoylglutathione lyase
MSTRNHYPHGVPCFVDTLSHDVEAAKRFYAGIFGWEFAGPGAIPDDPPGEYYVARVGGDDVAAVGTQPASVPLTAWNTYIAVRSADEAAADARAGGGTVVAEPFDVPPAGRMAVVADPSGATVGVWEAGQRRGAGRVNEPSAWAMSMLSTTDPESAQAFYGRLFGWQAEPFEAGPEMRVWLWRLPGYVGGEPQQPAPRDVVAAMTAAVDSPSNWGVDFWIEDADAAAASAHELGGAVIAPPFEAAGFRRTVLADPGGAAFSASQLLLA